MRLAGKVALISGAAGGMGAEEARLFAREGAKVIIADVLEDEGRQVEADIRGAGGEAVFVPMDVTREADWEQAVGTAVQRFGKLDVLVNNAGLSSTSVDDPLETAGWHRIMQVNTTGVFLGTRFAIPAMQAAGGGSIVNISSIMGFVGGESGHPAYHASKGAVRIFTKAIAVQYGPDNIRANSIPIAGGNPEYVGRIRLPQRPGGAGWGIGAVDGHAAAGHGLSQRNVGLRCANPTYMLPSA